MKKSYAWFMLMFDRKQQNSVRQLSFLIKKINHEIKIVKFFKRDWISECTRIKGEIITEKQIQRTYPEGTSRSQRNKIGGRSHGR